MIKKILVLSTLFVFAAIHEVSVAQTNSVIVLFGDSITVGFNRGRPIINANGSTTISGPRAFLSDILNDPDQPRPSIVANWGEGGSSSSRGVQRIVAQLSVTRNAIPADQYFVLIMYGTNDFGRGIGTSTTAFNNQEMIRRARSVGYTPIVGTVTPRSDRNLAPLAGAIFNTAVANNAPVANHFGVFSQRPLIDLVELETSGLTGLPIRLHPRDVGYQLIAQTWFDQVLSGLIEPVAEPVVVAPIIQLLLGD